MNCYLCLLINTFLYIPEQGNGAQRGPGYTMFLGISFMASVHRATYACAFFYIATRGYLTLCFRVRQSERVPQICTKRAIMRHFRCKIIKNFLYAQAFCYKFTQKSGFL